MFEKAIKQADILGIPLKAGNVLSSDEFYTDDFNDYKHWAEFGALCVEMETSGLYTIAAKYNVKALSILTISDSLVTRERTTAKEREKTFVDMTKIALSIT